MSEKSSSMAAGFFDSASFGLRPRLTSAAGAAALPAALVALAATYGFADFAGLAGLAGVAGALFFAVMQVLEW